MDPTPTISLYQNADHIAGILQQVLNAGLLTGENRENLQTASDRHSLNMAARPKASVALKVPGLGGGSAEVEADGGGTHEYDSAQDIKSTQSYEFSQAYWLYHVRNQLRSRDQLRKLATNDQALQLRSGDFVEFQATFEPSAINAMLDILTPEFVSGIAYFVSRKRSMERLKKVTGR